MGLVQQFATNRKSEKEGVELKFEANADGSIPTLIIAREFGPETPERRRVFERVSKPHKHEIDTETLSETDDLHIMARVFAEISVKGWKNVRLPLHAGGIGLGDYDDAVRHEHELVHSCDIPFTVEHCTKLFELMPDLFKYCAAFATNADNFRAGALEEMAKN